MQDAMILWDGLFACDPTLEIAQWICVAMLIRIRNKRRNSFFSYCTCRNLTFSFFFHIVVIPSDYSTQLTYLLRYPTPPLAAPDLPHHATLLLRQAVALQMSPNPSTGASIVVENRNLLNIPIEIPDPPAVPLRRAQRSERSHQPSGSESPSRRDLSGSRQGHYQQPSFQMGLPESIARGILDRGESMGINKSFLSAVSELRVSFRCLYSADFLSEHFVASQRNIPDLAASLVRTLPNTPPPSYAAFPLMDERPPEQRPPWEPRSRFEMERDVSEMRLLNKQLGKSVSWIVDVLLQDEDGVTEPQQLKDIQTKKREALESLSYVRDVLNSGTTKVDEERLWGEQEFQRRSKDAAMGSLGDVLSQDVPQVNISQPAAPAPLHINDTRSRDISGFRNSTGASSLSLPTNPPLAPRSPPPAKRPTHSPSSSLSPPSQSLALAGPSAQLPPWHSTPSGFSGVTSSVAPALPRLPPRTSTTYRPPPHTASVLGHAQTPPSGHSTSDRRSPRLEVQQDPLGVIK